MYEWPKFDNGKPQLSLRKEVPGDTGAETVAVVI